MLTIAQISTPSDIADVAGLVKEFFIWGLTLNPDAKNAATFHDLETELASLPGIFGPPDGRFLLARLDGAPVGCVALRTIAPRITELKRMYVRPGHRGQRIGQTLVTTLIDEARSLNATRIDLSSWHTMTSAHAIYRALGFKDVPAPPDLPANEQGRVIFMELALT